MEARTKIAGVPLSGFSDGLNSLRKIAHMCDAPIVEATAVHPPLLSLTAPFSV